MEVEGLACWRGGRLVLADVGFALKPGEALTLRGPNGSGKSTLLRLVAGFLEPDAGRIRFGGEDLRGREGEVLHYVGHASPAKPLLSVEENLGAAVALAGGGTIDAGLDALGLARLRRTPARFLSAGQRRRLALARLAAVPRSLWLLDEPGVGLDAESRGRLEALILRHRAGGGTVVAATHGDVALDRAYVLELG